MKLYCSTGFISSIHSSIFHQGVLMSQPLTATKLTAEILNDMKIAYQRNVWPCIVCNLTFCHMLNTIVLKINKNILISKSPTFSLPANHKNIFDDSPGPWERLTSTAQHIKIDSSRAAS